MVNKEDYHRFRFLSFIGYGSVVMFVYIVTLGFAFEFARRRLDARVEAKCSRYDEETRRSVNFRKEIRKYLRSQEKALAESARLGRGIQDRVEQVDRDLQELDRAIRSHDGRRASLTRGP